MYLVTISVELEDCQMKSGIKRVTSIRTIPLLVVAVLVVIGTVFAGPAKDPVSGCGETKLDFDTGYASGEGTLNIRHTELAVKIKVQLLGPPAEGDDGTLHADVMHVFTFANGEITTNDKAVMDPTEGGFVLNERMAIVEGTGDFAGVSGKLTVHGLVMFTTETMADVSYELHGTIAGY
jgi:hypothetical protein